MTVISALPLFTLSKARTSINLHTHSSLEAGEVQYSGTGGIELKGCSCQLPSTIKPDI